MARRHLIEEELTHSAIGAFYEVYNHLKYGVAEHLCAKALEIELIARGHRVERELVVIVYYKGRELGTQRLDIVVDGKLIIEVKSTQNLHASAKPQLFNYLRVTRLEVGLLLHFGPEPKFYRLICPNDERSG